LDSFAHVNNAVFLNYLEHARWEMIKLIGAKNNKTTLAEAFGDGVLPVIRRVEIDYLSELKFGDSFDVVLWPTKVSESTFVMAGDIVVTDSLNKKSIGKTAYLFLFPKCVCACACACEFFSFFRL
jgi:acyl-CoA thioester hydrolase